MATARRSGRPCSRAMPRPSSWVSCPTGCPAGGVDVLKVGHHGSKKSLDASLAERLSPAVALIGVGEHNRYGHPSREVLDLLDASGCATYCSDEAGDVVVAFSEDTLTVSAQRQG